jgi:aryl-alcohol dehydrogenase-like predicted oxidoreductase
VYLRQYGRTGLEVPALGFGAMQVGDPALPESLAAKVLNEALDAGLVLIDTARSYGLSEQRIGMHLARRRDEFVLSTKVGYGVDGVADWTYESVMAGVDAARDRLRTDIIDIVHLHSCDRDRLAEGAVTDALLRCAELGKVRVIAYSGDADPLIFALKSGVLGAVQVSVNVCDQEGIDLLRSEDSGHHGVIAKRPLAGRPWAATSEPGDPTHAEYYRRFHRVREAVAVEPADWDALALRFSAYADGVDCCIVGGSNIDHIRRNAEAVAKGPLPAEEHTALRDAFRSSARAWRGLV